jgi:membrane associated rhomboid family serine protease
LIPIKDSPTTGRFPFVNLSLIIINILVFFRQLTLTEPELHSFIFANGLIPKELITGLFAENLAVALTPLIAYQFMHGGWLHIGSNMLYLWVFGDNIEDRLGHFKYLLFYLLMGVISGLAQVAFDPGSNIPIIGASGAVAGILGAYLVSCPRARVLALIPVFIVFTVAELPAVVFLGFWFLLQLFQGVASIGVDVSIAWWAHIAGFVGGMLLVSLFGKRLNCK